MGITCKAAIALGNGKFIIDTITVADPKDDEVIVKMKAAGICHTDSDSIHWGKQLVMGHEGSGIIEKVGDKVTNLKPGDAVILNWATPCLECFQCVRGNQHLCENNSPVVAGGNGYNKGHAHLEGTSWNNKPILRSFNLGTLSEFALVKSSACVIKESDKIAFKEACIISCGVMTGYGSVVNAAKLTKGSSAVIIGCGGVGLNIIQTTKISGAAKIIAVDVNESKLELAKTFGATHTILADKNDVGLVRATEEVKVLTEGRGADYAFECTAIPALGATPLAMVRNAGMAIQVSGIEQEIPFDMNLFEWDKIYINPLYGQCNPQIDFPKIVNLYDKGELLLDEMITKTYALNDLDKAIDDLLKGKNIKGVIIF